MLPKYELVDNKKAFHDDHWCVKITEGDYEGLVYQYDVVRIDDEVDDNGAAQLTFNTITIDNPNNVDLTQENDKGILGGILVEIISQQLEEMNENRTPDSSQSA